MVWKTLNRKAFIDILEQRPSAVRVLDIRPQEQFDAAHVRGSQHYDCVRLRRFAEHAAHDTPIVLICRCGRTSCHAAMWFDQLGFTAIHSLDGGIEGMQQYAPEWLIGTEKES